MCFQPSPGKNTIQQTAMSTDLELYNNLPKLRLIPIKIHDDPKLEQQMIMGSDDFQDDGQRLECHTPTSTEHRIPAVLSCPPAPRKPGRSRASCKSKPSNVQFFEIMNREDVDMFFVSLSKKPAGFSSPIIA